MEKLIWLHPLEDYAKRTQNVDKDFPSGAVFS